MTAPLPAATIPYGIRNVTLTKYTDAAGSVLNSVSVRLPYMQTFSFTEAEEFEELRGDDRLVAVHGSGAMVEWELEAGGISPAAWSIITGGSYVEEGVTPNRTIRMRKLSTQARPYFRVEGQAISDSGGDVLAIVYRCKATEEVEGEFADGEFFVTTAAGQGLPLPYLDWDLLYDLVQRETSTSISLTPVPNPLAAPANLSTPAKTATTVDLNWDDVPTAASYEVHSKTGAGAYSAVAGGAGGAPTLSATSVTGLTTATAYTFKVRAKNGTVFSDFSSELAVTTS